MRTYGILQARHRRPSNSNPTNHGAQRSTPFDDTIASPPTPTDPPSPPSRGLHSLTLAAAAPGSGTGSASAALYVYGGAPQSGSMYNDLWRLDLETGGWSWVQLDPAGAAPHVSSAGREGGAGRVDERRSVNALRCV